MNGNKILWSTKLSLNSNLGFKVPYIDVYFIAQVLLELKQGSATPRCILHKSVMYHYIYVNYIKLSNGREFLTVCCENNKFYLWILPDHNGSFILLRVYNLNSSLVISKIKNARGNEQTFIQGWFSNFHHHEWLNFSAENFTRIQIAANSKSVFVI